MQKAGETDVPRSATPHVVSARDRKYDRQLRLWAANGQAALEEAHVVLLTASAAGAETLKNLVLPGTGSFTVVDDKLTTEEDVDVNFFLDESSIGHPRAAKVAEFLQELNTDSVGRFESLTLSEFDKLDPSYWEKYSLVVAHQIRPSVLLPISKVLWDKKIPLVIINSIGFYARLRIVTPEHTVVESHPESTVDLRLDCPWPELERFAFGIELDGLSEMDHAHVPYLALLLIYLKQWKDAHGGSPPSTYAEKKEFKALIKTGVRSSDAENFDEAINTVWRATQATTIPSNSQAILNDDRAQNLSPSTSKFWILARAISDFTKSPSSGGHLPLSGTLPDMKADTTSYIKLQSIYRSKALEDRDWVASRVSELLLSLGRPADAISSDEVDTFCKFSRNLVVFDGRSLEEEYTPSTARAKKILQELEEENSLMSVYVGFRAVEVFEEREKRYPGTVEEVDEDEKVLKEIALEIVGSLGGTEVNERTASVLKEFVRYGGGELHNISSLLGGIAAQEIVKLITRQYVPMTNTTIFDGIQSSSAVWEL
ncbi:hypothetical protein BZA70DRAFT_198576 [Myxozyma melibiosi]|uniref:NEDD8-activating enzyme E1 regulatory subunit n=1 Tax=Myxozyma melibiosi TaxID=54550 RepID=A0ABR1F4G7_9ASCO